MQVILQENVPSLGFVGDVVNVKSGFARNYLIPQQKAVLANESNIKSFQHIKKLIEVKKAQKKNEAEELKKRLEGLTIIITHAATDGEKLFGSVGVAEAQEQIKQAGFDIDRRLIKIEAPIRTLGEHIVEIKLHQDVLAHVKLTVQKPQP